MTLHFCRGALNIRGEHFGCDWPTDEAGHHYGWAHANMLAQAIWATDPSHVRISPDTAPELLTSLRQLGDEYGPLGVALAAADMTDTRLLLQRLVAEQASQPEESTDG